MDVEPIVIAGSHDKDLKWYLHEDTHAAYCRDGSEE